MIRCLFKKWNWRGNRKHVKQWWMVMVLGSVQLWSADWILQAFKAERVVRAEVEGFMERWMGKWAPYRWRGQHEWMEGWRRPAQGPTQTSSPELCGQRSEGDGFGPDNPHFSKDASPSFSFLCFPSVLPLSYFSFSYFVLLFFPFFLFCPPSFCSSFLNICLNNIASII